MNSETRNVVLKGWSIDCTDRETYIQFRGTQFKSDKSRYQGFRLCKELRK